MTKDNVSDEISAFLNATDSMLSSKYLMIDRRIADVLHAIADTPSVYNLIKRCMINFDFRNEFDVATLGSEFRLPIDDERKIAFIFCLLSNIDSQKIDVTILLQRYFSYDAMLSPYELFCKLIVQEFKTLVLKELGLVGGDKKSDKKKDDVQVFGTGYEQLCIMLRDLNKFVSEQKKLKKCFMPKYDLIAVISTFSQVVMNHQVEYFYAFLVTINSALDHVKECKERLREINRCCDALIKGK